MLNMHLNLQDLRDQDPHVGNLDAPRAPTPSFAKERLLPRPTQDAGGSLAPAHRQPRGAAPGGLFTA